MRALKRGRTTARRALCVATAGGLLIAAIPAASGQEPVQQWRFGTGSVTGTTLRAAIGDLPGEILGEHRLTQDGTLQFMQLVPSAADPEVGGILLAPEAKASQLPVQNLTVEGWVQIDRAIEWGGIIGAVHDTGTNERGWILGYGTDRFYFGVAAEVPARITYLRASERYLTGCWYHLAATYDGAEMRLYVDGKLSARHDGQHGRILQPDPAIYTIGAYRDDDNFHPFSGKLEQVTVWHRALTGEELAQRFEARKAEFPGIERIIPKRPGAPSDWTTWMGDNARSGQAGEAIPLPLNPTPAWVHFATSPAPAWPETAPTDFWRNRSTPEIPRATFDWIHGVVVADGRLYYGSSRDDTLRCLEARTGTLLWSFPAGGPIRLAPTVSGGAVLFGCDDGAVYCLDAVNGALRWTARPPSARDERLPGNGRLISLWPVRTGVLVTGETATFGAGLFPTEGCWQCEVEVASGRILTETPLAISPQGYLHQRDNEVVAATGRVASGSAIGNLATHRQEKVTTVPPASPIKGFPYAAVSAGGITFAGGERSVAAFEQTSGKVLWEAEVDAPARGLAIAAGQLFVSTESGRIYAFAHGAAHPQEPPAEGALQRVEQSETGRRLAGLLSRERGYILVVGLTDGALLHELALHTGMQVVGVERDEALVMALRRKVASWAFRERPSIQLVRDFNDLPFVAGLFNLVTSERDDVLLPAAERQRLLRPADGVAIVRGAIERARDLPGAGGWTHLYGDAGNTASSGGDPLPDGPLRPQWFGDPGPHHMVDRHLRAPPPLAANGYLFVPGRDFLFGIDACNGTILWEQAIPDFTRVAVLRDSGNLALAGDNTLYAAAGPHCLAINPDTGTHLRTHSVDPDMQEWAYLAVGGPDDELLIGSAAPKGAIRREVAKVTIFGGAYGDRQRIVCSEALFALDRQSGERRWSYEPRGAIFNPSLCLSSGHLYFIESNDPRTLGRAGSREGDRSDPAGAGGAEPEAGRWHFTDLIDRSGATLVALDVASGRPAWRHRLPAERGIQTLFLSCTDEHLVLVNSRNVVAPGQAPEHPTLHYETQVFRPSDGELRWAQRFDTGRRKDLIHGEQDLHPVLTGGMLIVEPQVYDLASGEELFTFQRSGGGGCGTLSASAGRLFYRASHPATFDLTKREQEKIVEIARPGCWINMIPAGGLLLVPEGSSGCICSYPIQASMAFRPDPKAVADR